MGRLFADGDGDRSRSRGAALVDRDLERRGAIVRGNVGPYLTIVLVDFLQTRGQVALSNPHDFHAPQSSYSKEDLLKSSDGGYFGPGNAQLPAPPMLMMDRITEISLDGGEFGKACVAWSPPPQHQNRPIVWDVVASSKYPKGRGTLLRLRDGLRVGIKRESGAIQLAAMLIGVFPGRPARLTIKFAASTPSSSNLNQWSIKTLWKPAPTEPSNADRRQSPGLITRCLKKATGAL